MPTNMFYSAIGAEILRISRVSSSMENIHVATRTLMKRALKQGATKERMEKTLKKMYGRHDILKQFGNNALEFVNSLW